MQFQFKKVGVTLAAGVLALGLAGCSSTSTASSSSSESDNSQVVYTSLESEETQEFETVEFGTYTMSDGTTGAITWYVLDEQDGKTLLISEEVLDAQPYDDGDEGYEWQNVSQRPTTDVDWADCSLRTWLNSDFMNTAFTADEQASIVETDTTTAKSNTVHSADDAADASVHTTEATTDKVFILDVAEARQYFNNSAARIALPTSYAVSEGVYTGIASNDNTVDGAASWWLRSVGYYSGYEAVVNDDGYIDGDGYRINGEVHDGNDDHGTELTSDLGGNFGVRPCIWVESSALSS
jgi:hypothetical protein